MAFKSNAIILCSFCGEKGKTKLCLSCSTKEKRTKKVLEQLEIEKEQKKNGYDIPKTLFGFNRQALLETYGLA